jgi:serine/threonine protein phosphatase 1
MLKFLDDSTIADAWFSYGGMATLASYNVRPVGSDTDSRNEQFRKGLIQALPPSHLHFLRSLELSIEIGSYLFVHAGIRPGKPLDEQRREDMLTIRDAFFAASDLPWRVVHGHTVTDEPQVLPHRIGIDTGAYMSGVLTCVVIDGNDAHILAA